MRFAKHVFNECYLDFILQRRYWFETVMGLGLILFAFLGLFYGFAVDSVATEGSEIESLDRLIMGFAVWLFATGCYTSSTNDIATEVANKTLEQLATAPKSLAYLISVKTVVHMFSAAIIFIVVLSAMCLITGTRLDINYLVLVSTLLLAAPSLIGIGYITAGIALIHKKATVMQSIVFIGIVGLVTVQAYPIDFMAAAPFALGASIAKNAVSGIEFINTIPALVVVVLNSITYFALGAGVFAWCDIYARKKGTLCHA